MDYFAAHHSSSTSSPALSASDSMSMESFPQINEYGLDSIWPDDSSALPWDLDFPQDFAAGFLPNDEAADLKATESALGAQSTQPTIKRKDNGMAPDKTSKRREQNRASQRLFRERKIHYVKGVEQQLEDLNEKYQDLVVSFNNQTKEKVVMLSQIARLTAKLARKD